MLMVAYDALEISRFLYAERNILHRDFSKGNILCLKNYQKACSPTQTDQGPAQTSSTEVLTDASLEAQERKPSFIKFLLNNSDDPQETSTLVIDFNCSEDLKGRERTAEDAADRIGTPIFIARAVELGGPVPLGYATILKAIPGCSVVSYVNRFPERIKKFEGVTSRIFDPQKPLHPHPWRRQLHHEAESIFWVVVYWAILAKPAKTDVAMTPAQQNKTTTQLPTPPDPVWTPVLLPSEPSHKEFIPLSTWSSLVGGWEARTTFLYGMYRGGGLHPNYKALLTLIQELASYLTTDPYWFGNYNPNDPRTDPEYIHECFQRLILEFVDDNFNKSFMILPIDEKGRVFEQILAGNVYVSTQMRRSDHYLKRESHRFKNEGCNYLNSLQTPESAFDLPICFARTRVWSLRFHQR
ncbi:hypothetical protein EST38_g7205 [Candolleomyces aberdarensis]|uniref:Fungal-type protein kinase domain-containing protein n=1 Tax=Candolleomyces aberdarensis TaxID=2316362 RepID=A0A4Q2DHJ9_9AGAR|nr:hypothetical protein EST38_g7205 [Candolleomyces aberdarensis]